jgi:hypothetical protein
MLIDWQPKHLGLTKVGWYWNFNILLVSFFTALHKRQNNKINLENHNRIIETMTLKSQYILTAMLAYSFRIEFSWLK